MRITRTVSGILLGLVLAQTAFAQQPLPSKTTAATLHIAGKINSERINLRQGPGADYKRVTLLDKETEVVVTAREGDWVQIELSDGKSGWIGQKYIATDKPLPAPKPAAALNNKQQAASTTQVTPNAQRRTPNAQPPTTNTKSPAPRAETGIFAGTKDDILQQTRESPAATLGDSFRLLLYLLPILGLIVLSIRGLKAFQERHGSLPSMASLKKGMLGGFNLANARKTGGSNIRIIESVPVGTVGLHLIEVKGKTLLLGATGTTVTKLMEFSETKSEANTDFSTLLASASSELDDETDDYTENSGGIGTVVGSLDESLREAREAIIRNANRARQWNEGNVNETNSDRSRRG